MRPRLKRTPETRQRYLSQIQRLCGEATALASEYGFSVRDVISDIDGAHLMGHTFKASKTMIDWEKAEHDMKMSSRERS